MLSRMEPPRIAVQNGTFTAYSRSLPGSGCSAAARRATAAAALKHVAEVEAAEVEAGGRAAARTLATAGKATTGAGARVGLGRRRINIVAVVAELVVNLALLRIAQHVVGFRDVL